jgi:hypothetical protein
LLETLKSCVLSKPGLYKPMGPPVSAHPTLCHCVCLHRRRASSSTPATTMKGRGSTSHLPQLRPPRSSHLPQPWPTRAAAPRPCTHLAEERKPPEEEMPVAVSRGGEEGARISRRKAPGSCPMLIPNERKPRKRWCGAMAASLYDSTIALMTHLRGLFVNSSKTAVGPGCRRSCRVREQVRQHHRPPKPPGGAVAPREDGRRGGAAAHLHLPELRQDPVPASGG